MEKFDVKFMHPRDQITLIISKIYKSGLTTTSGGNISIIDEDQNIWVTPSAVDKGSLTPKDIMCVKADGTIMGPHKVSSEYPFHKAIFESRTDIKAIIHAHPPALVSFSTVRKIPDTNVIPQAKKVCGPIGYAPYEIPGSEALGISIAREFQKSFHAVIMENHGIVVGGKDLLDAYERFETLEFAARTIINAKTIGEPQYLSNQQIDTFENQIPHNLPNNEDVCHPSEEREIRKEICQLVRRACDQGLMISTYGTASIRWKDNDFLITPTNIPRWNLDPEDIVQIRNGKKETHKIPSRSVQLHHEIYKANPGVHSIILTQAPNIMAYGVSNKNIDVRTIPESWIFLQDIPKLPFGSHFTGNLEIPEIFSKGSPAVIVQNDSIIVTGNSLLHAFDRLEVAEFSAKSLIMGSVLGDFQPIKDDQVEALRKKFL